MGLYTRGTGKEKKLVRLSVNPNSQQIELKYWEAHGKRQDYLQEEERRI